MSQLKQRGIGYNVGHVSLSSVHWPYSKARGVIVHSVCQFTIHFISRKKLTINFESHQTKRGQKKKHLLNDNAENVVGVFSCG